MKTWIIIGLLIVILIVVGVYIFNKSNTDIIEVVFTRIKNTLSSIGYKIKVKLE
ncbi:MAG: hypothetical protein ACYSWS_05530 [Planctomycetota bacterium]|jgi:hypothetical protein